MDTIKNLMRKNSGKYILTIFIFHCLCSTAFSQADSIPHIDLAKLKSILPVLYSGYQQPIPAKSVNNNISFLDSLKQKASRNQITRKLYDLVIVSPELSDEDNYRTRSESSYLIFSGKRIRNIDITRLPAFGSNIDHPYNPYKNKTLDFLNKTHIKTLESVVRNNLLFQQGDTVSPVLLSDNERLLRDLSFIDDARINLVPVSEEEVDVRIVTKDIYSLGGTYSPSGIESGNISLFENNILGLGHELGINIPYDSDKLRTPGFGIHYLINNIKSTFLNLRVFYYDGLEEESYGINLNRRFISSETKYAGGLLVQHLYRFEDMNRLVLPEQVRYNLQDFWLGRSFLLDPLPVRRIILSARYTNNNVLERPPINADSYHSLQNYRLYLGSLAFSQQTYYHSNLIYNYGRTEDIPTGGLVKVTLGREINEFKNRLYAGTEISFGKTFKSFGYIHAAAGMGSFLNHGNTEQGIVFLNASYFSNLIPLGRNMIRNFVRLDLTRGFDRNDDEFLRYYNDNGFSGIRNDSVSGRQRINIGLETVVFSPYTVYGFRFTIFGFADFSSISSSNQNLIRGTNLSGVGIGMRLRNDNLVFNTFQVRIGFFPNPPQYSRINSMTFSGEQPLRLDNFDSDPPSVIPYR
jgi:hypothetical protein